MGRCCHDHSDLTVVTKNMLLFDLFSAVGPDEGLERRLPSYIQTLGNIYTPGPAIITQGDVARTHANYYEQVSRDDLLSARTRLSALALELSQANADVIGLQECLYMVNNPIVNQDGSRNAFPFKINNGGYGNESSDPKARVYDYAQMLVDRLKNDHGQEFVIASRIMPPAAQAPRTLNALNDSEATLMVYNTCAILVRKSKHTKIKDAQSHIFTNALSLNSAPVVLDDPQLSNTTLAVLTGTGGSVEEPYATQTINVTMSGNESIVLDVSKDIIFMEGVDSFYFFLQNLVITNPADGTVTPLADAPIAPLSSGEGFEVAGLRFEAVSQGPWYTDRLETTVPASKFSGDADGTVVIRCGFQEEYAPFSLANVKAPFDGSRSTFVIRPIEYDSERQYSFDLVTRYSFETGFDGVFVSRIESAVSTTPFGFDWTVTRGYNKVDLCHKGRMVRILNTHLQSGGVFNNTLVGNDSETNWNSFPAARAAQSQQLLREEILPSPFPVLLVGDLNEADLTQTLQLSLLSLDPVGVAKNLLCGVDENGLYPTNEGGPMIDTCVAANPATFLDEQFQTIGLTNEGPDWVRLRSPEGIWQARIDFILTRRSDPVQVLESTTTNTLPLPQSATQPWAWASDHRGVKTRLRLL